MARLREVSDEDGPPDPGIRARPDRRRRLGRQRPIDDRNVRTLPGVWRQLTRWGDAVRAGQGRSEYEPTTVAPLAAGCCGANYLVRARTLIHTPSVEGRPAQDQG